MDGMLCRLIRRGEEEETFSMIERGFSAFVQDDFSQEGVDEFHRAIRDMVFKGLSGIPNTILINNFIYMKKLSRKSIRARMGPC